MQHQNSDSHFNIIGHRGAGGEQFENSLSAFKHALHLNIDAIELDIRKNGEELWVIHDNDLERLTGKSGSFENIDTASTLLLNNGEPVPTLREILNLYWGIKPINIEIKSSGATGLLLELLAEYSPPSEPSEFPWILISSFDHEQLLELRQLNCPWPLAPITLGLLLNPEQLIDELKPYSWHMDDEYPNSNYIGKIQSRGVKVFIYTVNDEDRVEALKNTGVDGVFTDFPSNFQPAQI